MLAMVRPLTFMNDDVGYGEPLMITFEHGSNSAQVTTPLLL